MSEEDVKTQFGRTAKGYVNSTSHSGGRGLELLHRHAAGISDSDALDIATGGGHTAFLLAREGARVTALDLTPEMLIAASDEAKKLGLNIDFVEGNAEALPFSASSFDLVTCRIAPHHFIHPGRFIAEASRVLKQNGWLYLIDNVSSEREDFAGALNHIEKLRDPTHIRAYTVGEWARWISQSGLDLHCIERWKKRKSFSNWIERSKTPDDMTERIAHYAAALPEDTKRYLELEFSDQGISNISHETAFFSAIKVAVTEQQRT